jgi:predicted deacylase
MVLVFISFSSFQQAVQAADFPALLYPSRGQIAYGSTSSRYMPWTRKEAIVPAFMSLADRYGGTYESIGTGSSSYGWDIILFKFGNPNGGPIMIDCFIHGNEFYTYEVIYSLMNWLLTSGDADAERILENNYVLVVPVVNYRWGRTNYNSPSWMTARDPSMDGGKCGVNLNRNFDPKWSSSLSHSNTDSYSGISANSEKEAQALINAWTLYEPRVYWNLHQGMSPKTWCKAVGTQARSDADEIRSLLPSIQSSIGVTGTKWTFSISSTSGGGLSYGKSASMGIASFMTEIMSGWDNSANKRADLDGGNTFKQVKALFIAMCRATE